MSSCNKKLVIGCTKPDASDVNMHYESIDKIRCNLPGDWKVLSEIYDWLYKEQAFCYEAKKDVTQVVKFLQPEDLKKSLDLNIEEHKTLNVQEIAKLCVQVINHSVKTAHPGFHNQLFGQMDPYGLIGAWITEALNTSAYTYEVAPVFSLIETELISKVCEIFGYEHGDGILTPGGSMSNMYGMVLARYKRFPNIKTEGVFGMRPLVVFTSQDGHYSIKKAAHWLGFGDLNCVVVKTNKRGQMLVHDLEEQILRVLEEDRIPLFVNATAGTTVLGAFDDLHSIANVCAKYGLWLHVDACLGGSAMLSIQNKHLMAGIERAHSFSWNPHKTLGAPLQCSLFVTSEQNLLSQCNSVEVHYLFQQDKFYDVSYDTGNKSIQCGRKVDAFKFWLMLKARGCSAYGHLVDHAINTARLFTQKLKERGEQRGFRVVLDDYQYSNSCFWYIPKSMRNQKETNEWWNSINTVAPKIKERMVYEGNLLIGYSPLQHHGLKNFFRIVFTCFPIRQESELDAILDEIERLGESIQT